MRACRSVLVFIGTVARATTDCHIFIQFRLLLEPYDIDHHSHSYMYSRVKVPPHPIVRGLGKAARHHCRLHGFR